MTPQFGMLAAESGVRLPLCVLKSAAGFYIGTVSDEGPFSRESEEYWPSAAAAESALASNSFTQRVDN